VIATPTSLRIEPNDEASVVRELAVGDAFSMLDDSLGWAWGYSGNDRRVGYVRSNALANQ
jgi:hypothetical protein